jgi:hypothetical protein
MDVTHSHASLSELLKSVLEESLRLSNCQLDEDTFAEISQAVRAEVSEVGESIKRSFRESDAQTIIKAAKVKQYQGAKLGGCLQGEGEGEIGPPGIFLKKFVIKNGLPLISHQIQ